MSKQLLEKIIAQSKKAIFGEMVGNNVSFFKGEGFDFFELREYQEGDDFRHISWLHSAKEKKILVKVFHKEKQANIGIFSILNGSVFFGSKRLKQEVIAQICATLSFGAIQNNDSVSNFIFCDKLYDFTKPTKKINSIYYSTKKILDFNPIEKTFEPQKLEEELLRLKKRSLIFLVGDYP